MTLKFNWQAVSIFLYALSRSVEAGVSHYGDDADAGDKRNVARRIHRPDLIKARVLQSKEILLSGESASGFLLGRSTSNMSPVRWIQCATWEATNYEITRGCGREGGKPLVIKEV
jgi:hypothetical protein